MTEGERLLLIGRHPRLALFSGGTVSGHPAYGKLDPRCWFLAPSGRCGVEDDLGRAAKPLVCRAHPIYFARYGGLSVTTLAPGCHWAPGGAAGVAWAEVESLHLELIPVIEAARPPAPWSDAFLMYTLRAETAIRDAAPGCARVVDYLAWQVACAVELCGDRGVPAGDPPALSEARAYLDALETVIGAVLGVAPAEVPASAALERMFLHFSGLLRLSLFGLTPSFGSAAPPVRSARHLLAAAAPMLLALYLYARVADQVGFPGVMADYNAVHQMLMRARDRLFALARLLHAPSPAAVERLDREAAPARALGALARRAPRAPLGDLLVELGAGQSVEERIGLLDVVGRALAAAAPAESDLPLGAR
jgi:hypothetical protein